MEKYFKQDREREKGRKTSRNYVDSDNETEQNSTPDHVFSVGDKLSHGMEVSL